jgi:hypothetical protein
MLYPQWLNFAPYFRATNTREPSGRSENDYRKLAQFFPLAFAHLSWYIVLEPWRRKGGNAAPIRPCRNFWGDEDICLEQNFRSFFCHQMRKSNEICENLGFILVATVTDFLSARLHQSVTIATSESSDFHRFRYSPSSGGRKRNKSFPWVKYHHRLKNLPDQFLLHS